MQKFIAVQNGRENISGCIKPFTEELLSKRS
jgi:hypothetical protein